MIDTKNKSTMRLIWKIYCIALLQQYPPFSQEFNFNKTQIIYCSPIQKFSANSFWYIYRNINNYSVNLTGTNLGMSRWSGIPDFLPDRSAGPARTRKNRVRLIPTLWKGCLFNLSFYLLMFICRWWSHNYFRWFRH